jgi:dienelactone hydrolase
MIAKFPASAAARARARALIALLAVAALRAESADPPRQLVAFDRYGDPSSYGELARRLLSPFEAEQFMRRLAASGGKPASQPLDLAREQFLVHVPPVEPESGYGLLVFVPPWQQAGLPGHWVPILDQRAMLFVTAARSGNKEGVMDRREPLALLATINVMQRYRIDPRRVYIGGFSGGSRIALRLALGYPDLFRGALLNAGSDVIGNGMAEPPVPLPPRELLYRFQEHSRLVYLTGERDPEHIADDQQSVQSLATWCIYDRYQFQLPRVEHSVADATGFARALDALDGREDADRSRLGRCRDALQAELDAKFRKVDSLRASGEGAAAQRLLRQIDRSYGGLAAPRSLELLHSLSPSP